MRSNKLSKFVLKHPTKILNSSTFQKKNLADISPSITIPYYALTSSNEPNLKKEIFLKTDSQDIKHLKESCSLASQALKFSEKHLKVGLTTLELDELVRNFIFENNAYPSPLFYMGFPNSICTSVNNVVCHGIPDGRKLIEGDIINVDITVYKNGFHGDCSKTFKIGNCFKDEFKVDVLLKKTEYALEEAINICKPGTNFKEIGKIIEKIAITNGFQVQKDFCGHGIGKEFHEPPMVYHYYDKDLTDITMQPGMSFTIEPMFCEGTAEVEFWKDGWTCVTRDDLRSAQFEHTVLITTTGCEVLTR